MIIIQAQFDRADSRAMGYLSHRMKKPHSTPLLPRSAVRQCHPIPLCMKHSIHRPESYIHHSSPTFQSSLVVRLPVPMTSHRHIRRGRRNTRIGRPPVPARPNVDAADFAAQCVLPVLHRDLRWHAWRTAISRATIGEPRPVGLLCVGIRNGVEVLVLLQWHHSRAHIAGLLLQPVSEAARRRRRRGLAFRGGLHAEVDDGILAQSVWGGTTAAWCAACTAGPKIAVTTKSVSLGRRLLLRLWSP